MACIEAFFIYNAKGDPVIHRLYRDNVNVRTVTDIFRTRVLHYQSSPSPVCQVGTLTLANIQNRDIYLVAVVRGNANIMMALQWLASLIQTFTQYFKKVKEKYIRQNYVLLYELLDEACDNGVPQITDASVLKEFIFQQGTFFGGKDKKKKVMDASVTHQVTGAVAHRNPKVYYKKNELFLDIVESVDALMSTDGTVLTSEVNGRLMLKAFLSGMPECSLGIDKTRLPQGKQACTFASIVSQKEWEVNSCARFVPPDNGNSTEFEIMRYRVESNVAVPFKVISNVVETGRTKCTVDIVVRSLYDPTLAANSIVITIPMPPLTAKVKFQKSKGDAKYDGAADIIRWTISKFRGQKEHRLSADATLVSATKDQKAWTRPPVALAFNIPMYSASPMRVIYLKVNEKSNYHVEKWVRKVCTAGTYHCRIK